MAASSAKSAFGTAVIMNNHIIAELIGVDGYEASVGEADVTHHYSSDAYKEFIPTLKAGGEITVRCNFISGDANGQAAAIADFESRTSRTWIVAFPNAAGQAATFTGFVKNYKLTGDLESALGFEATVKITGKPTYLNTGSTGLTNPYFALRDDSLNAITPTPAASGTVYEYDATAITTATHVAVQPTSATETIHVNGVAVTTGDWSANIALGAAGTDILVTVRVTGTDKAPKIYRITVLRASP